MVKAFNGMRAKTCPTRLTGSRHWQRFNGDETGARASPAVGSPGLFVNSLAEAAPQLLDLFAYTGDSAGYPTTIKRRNTQHADLLALFVHHEGQGYKVNTAKRDIGKERLVPVQLELTV